MKRSPEPGPTHDAVVVQFDEAYCSDTFLENVRRHEFSFNGETHRFCGDWRKNPSHDIEWLILLHKFYFAPGLVRHWLVHGCDDSRCAFESLVTSWLDQVPVDFLAIDVTARRVQNWAYAWALVQRAGRERAFPAGFRHRLFVSVQEHLNAVASGLAPARNHRTLELYALLIAASVFHTLPQAPRWRAFAIAQLADNVRQDLKHDGVHCEQSTDYHHLALRSHLLAMRIAQKAGTPFPDDVVERLHHALDFAMHVHRPDGDIPAVSDADSRSFLHLLYWSNEWLGREDHRFVASGGAKGTAPNRANRWFANSGYVVFRSPWTHQRYADARYLLLDAGPVGEGNHGHMDMGSVEVYAYGRPLIVDPGRYTYHEYDPDHCWQRPAANDLRHRFRATRSHNTVTVDDLDQGNYGRRRPGARCRVLKPHPHARVIAADLDGEPAFALVRILSPNYDAVHDRAIWFVHSRYWVIVDRLHGSTRAHEYRVRYQLTSEAEGRVRTTTAGGHVRSTSPGLTLHVAATTPVTTVVEPSWISRTYGTRLHAPRLCIRQSARSCCFLTFILPTADGRLCCLSQNAPVGNRQQFTVETDSAVDSWLWQDQTATLHHLNSAREWSLPALGGTADA